VLDLGIREEIRDIAYDAFFKYGSEMQVIAFVENLELGRSEATKIVVKFIYNNIAFV